MNTPLRGQLLREIESTESLPEKDMLRTLLSLYDRGLLDLSYDEQTGECVYQATELGQQIAGELE